MIDLRPGEARALAWSWLYDFALFLAYYVLRPIRDELGVAGGVRNLPWLFTGTLLAMLAVNPLFAYAVRRWPRAFAAHPPAAAGPALLADAVGRSAS